VIPYAHLRYRNATAILVAADSLQQSCPPAVTHIKVSAFVSKGDIQVTTV
jgi:hypothetical protein